MAEPVSIKGGCVTGCMLLHQDTVSLRLFGYTSPTRVALGNRLAEPYDTSCANRG